MGFGARIDRWVESEEREHVRRVAGERIRHNDVRRSIGRAIKGFREDAGLAQVEAAESAGVTGATAAGIEGGRCLNRARLKGYIRGIVAMKKRKEEEG
jgi:DNA-binding XRE family transcriptional regulator